ncbi:MAG: glycosyltransferase family 92 protein [Lachnospiraceae bacterium]|nr:glycosyltransferase family 92 protein [Lachnospiraceae bacterium]
MQRIIVYGIGQDFHTYFDEESLYLSLTMEMGISITAFCDGNKKRFGEKISVGEQVYEIRDICGISGDDYDYIVVTTNKYFQEIRESLVEKGADSKKVISLIDYLHDLYYEGTYSYRISIVLIIQNEASYMREWMEYHRMLGIEHFYIYDNKSTDDLREFLTEYIEQGIVTYQYWPDGQSEAYQHAVDHYKFESKYMAVIDVDEFLVPADHSKEDYLAGIVDGILAEHRKNMKYYGIQKQLGGGIGINWRYYGTGGHKKRPKGLVIENYMYRLDEKRMESAHIKTIANPRTIKRCHPHLMDYISGFACLSENGSYITELVFFDGRCEKLRVNHYFTRSEEEMYYKMCQRGYGYLKDCKASQDEWYGLYLNRLEDYHKSAVIYDPTIARFIAPLRERLSVLENEI